MEHRLFDPADPPEWLDPQWWRDRQHCDHLGSPTGAHVARLHAAAALAAKAAASIDSSSSTAHVVDLGAGDGALLSLLPDPLRDVSFGYDVISNDIIYAQRARGVQVRPILDLALDISDTSDVPLVELGPVVVLTEVLEHMADPHAFLDHLHARPEVRYVVASSPRRETPDKHEWNHAWCWDMAGYQDMFNAAGFHAVQYLPVEWSQLWLFEAVRHDPVELTTEEAVAALEDERDFSGTVFIGRDPSIGPEVPPWRAGDPGLRSQAARAAAVRLGFRPDGTR